jgi:translocator protein
MSRKTTRLWMLGLFVGICLAVGAVGGISSARSVGNWYAALDKPSWTPPDWVFGPVWTNLYVLIGIAGWLVWRGESGNDRRRAIRLWSAQMVVNFCWTPLFFLFHSPALAAVDIVLLWFLIGAFIPVARKVSRTAATLFLPYWAWVTYAATLNLGIWWMSRTGMQ